MDFQKLGEVLLDAYTVFVDTEIMGRHINKLYLDDIDIEHQDDQIIIYAGNNEINIFYNDVTDIIYDENIIVVKHVNDYVLTFGLS